MIWSQNNILEYLSKDTGANSTSFFSTFWMRLFSSTVTCETHVPLNGDLEEEGLDGKLPRGWYRIGSLQIRHDSSWFNLYRRRATGSGYWDFYTNIPERDCAGFVSISFLFWLYILEKQMQQL
ncbi:unnamed protein product [Toxocara canis]|uniref:Uncharacterized protein n=1 Tax=Toxocara canis TaxID=6265 RepID=A0A183U5X6_TOXCA|nr:unnamed protein product [Toxocara canis]